MSAAQFGHPITPKQNELLDVLIEECAEVIFHAVKLKRFGHTSDPRTGVSNTTALAMEMGQVDCMMEQVLAAGLLDKRDFLLGGARKAEKLLTHTKHQGDKL